MSRKRLKSRDRLEIYEMFTRHCAYCGCEIQYKEMQINHVEPLYNGGDDVRSNMLPACRSCNHYKQTYTLERFREALQRMPIAKRYGLVTESNEPVIFYFEKILSGED